LRQRFRPDAPVTVRRLLTGNFRIFSNPQPIAGKFACRPATE
jgi:hypothetical protein